jgi:pilus assembly protein Flp/PilA
MGIFTSSDRNSAKPITAERQFVSTSLHHSAPAYWNQYIRDKGISMLSIFRRLMKNEQGATAIEYTLIASLIAVAAIVSMGKVGGKVSNVLSNVANSMT